MEREKDTRRGSKKTDDSPPKRVALEDADALGDTFTILASFLGSLDAEGEQSFFHLQNAKRFSDIGATFVIVVQSNTDIVLTSLRLRLIATLSLIAKNRQAMQSEMQRLIETMTPAAAVPLPPQVLQAQRNAAARHLLVTEFGGLNSADIGELAGSKASNRAALAHRWKSDGRIFAVTHQGTPTFPGFQFSPEGQPLPVISELLAILGGTHSGWELALWFSGSNGWLGGRRPVDLLLTEPDRVIAAARHEAEALVF